MKLAKVIIDDNNKHNDPLDFSYNQRMLDMNGIIIEVYQDGDNVYQGAGYTWYAHWLKFIGYKVIKHYRRQK